MLCNRSIYRKWEGRFNGHFTANSHRLERNANNNDCLKTKCQQMVFSSVGCLKTLSDMICKQTQEGCLCSTVSATTELLAVVTDVDCDDVDDDVDASSVGGCTHDHCPTWSGRPARVVCQ